MRLPQSIVGRFLGILWPSPPLKASASWNVNFTKTQQSIKSKVWWNLFVAVDDGCDGIGEDLTERYEVRMSTSLLRWGYSIGGTTIVNRWSFGTPLVLNANSTQGMELDHTICDICYTAGQAIICNTMECVQSNCQISKYNWDKNKNYLEQSNTWNCKKVVV